MELSTARQLMAEFVEARRDFSLSGPEGFEDIFASATEGDSEYSKYIQIWDEGYGKFSLLLSVHSQELASSTVTSLKFNKILSKSAKAYRKQNVLLGVDGQRFLLRLALVSEETDLLQISPRFLS